MAEHPSPAGGLRLALRLHKLVLTAWLVSIAVFLPAQLMIDLTAGPARANLPDGQLVPGDRLLIFFELVRPIAVPLGLTLAVGWAVLAAWSILWHAGTVRWWMGAGAARVRLAEILGHGVVWWWRFARLAVVAAVVMTAGLGAVWLAIRAAIRGDGPASSAGGAWGLLIAGLLVSVLVAVVSWTATLRGGWMLGESGRRSALVAWLRGFAATVRSPLRSLVPVVVWGLPGLVLPIVPLAVDGVEAVPVLAAASLVAALCWVSLYLSFAPREPNKEWVRKMQERAASRVARPAETPLNYNTTRIPTNTAKIPTKPPEDR